MESQLAGLKIKRVIAHRIVADEEGNPSHVQLSSKLLDLQGEAMEALRNRIIGAVGADSGGIEMDVQKEGLDTTFQALASLLDVAATNDFVQVSGDVTGRLANAQKSQRIPVGVVVVFEGTCGTSSTRRVVGVIKAEIHDGFATEATLQDAVIVKFVKELFLTPAQRLYKIGVFVETKPGTGVRLSDDFSVTVFDQNAASGKPDMAAKYFYETFLGCTFQKSDRKLTQDFYEGTLTYINGAKELDLDVRNDISQALYTYLAVSATPTIRVREFSDMYMPAAQKGEYVKAMGKKGLPSKAFKKDLSLIQPSLKRRRIAFDSGVSITGPSPDFGKLVKVKEEDETSTILEVKGKGAWVR